MNKQERKGNWLCKPEKVSKAHVEWLTLDERREEDATGGKKLKGGGGINLITGNFCVRVPFLF